ncbi:MAG: hypothetical protein IKA53_03605 [Clostridia bacterium]|nr:hypothetical protein [Clostridia bacterium]
MIPNRIINNGRDVKILAVAFIAFIFLSTEQDKSPISIREMKILRKAAAERIVIFEML